MIHSQLPRIPAAKHLVVTGILISLALIACLRPAAAQSVEDANVGRTSIYVGGGVSGYRIQYGQRNLLGATLWVDGNSIRPLGIAGEARWLDWHQQANVHAETYLLGPRYRFHVARTQPYVKGLVGSGHFNFPYNFATGNYLVIAPGGGLDFPLGSRWSARADFEYQYWPEFTFGSMNAAGATIGIRCRVF